MYQKYSILVSIQIFNNVICLNLNYTFLAKTTVNLQDAYLDAVRQKLHNIESRITQAELLIPQIQLERQAHMEQTVHNMSTRVAFLNRRIDELMPPQWKSKMPVTIS